VTTGAVDALVAGATERSPMAVTDSKSGARFERVVLDGRAHVLKHVDRADDWIMRQTGDLGCVPVTVWESGVLDLLPDCVDHATVGAAREWTAGEAGGEGGGEGGEGLAGARGAVLMRDVGAALVRDDGSPLDEAQHLRFLDHLAACHAATLGWRDDVGLVPLANRYSFFGPDALACEAARPSPHPVPALAAAGWAQLPDAAPRFHELVAPLRSAPDRVLTALADPPHAFLHGDWKAANLGTDAQGRTVLVDWSMAGEGPLLTEVLHYATLNARRLPHGHGFADVLAVYRAALESRGVRTDPWWDTQLAACTIGVMLQLGWARAHDTPAAIAAWTARVEDSLRSLPC